MGDHALVIRLLLDAGANIDHKDNRHKTPLYAAAGNGQEVAVNLFLERNANISSRRAFTAPLIAAAQTDHVKIAKLLLDKGVDAPSLIYDTNLSPYFYALSCLSESGIDEDKPSFAVVLQESGNLSFHNEFERLPLPWAASRGDDTLVKRLFKAGCRPNPMDIFNRTLLFAAVCTQKIDVVRVLLDHPDIDAAEDKLGFTPLERHI